MSPLDNRNYYMIEYKTTRGKQGHLNVCILDTGWWMATDDLMTDPELYLDSLANFIRGELFRLNMKGNEIG